MKNKKTILSLVAYSAILLGLVGGLVGTMTYKTNADTLEVYCAQIDIESGTNVEDSFVTNYTKKIKVHRSLYNDMKANEADLIYNSIDFKGATKSFIPKGTIFTKQMFGDVSSLTVLEKYKQNGYEEPYFGVFEVSNITAPVSGFSEGQKVSIEGRVDLQESLGKDEELKEDAKEVFNGIISNKCTVNTLFYNEDTTLTHVGIILEREDYPVVSYFAEYGSIKFHEGVVENKWGTTNTIIMTDLWEKTGFKSAIAEDLKTFAEYKIFNESELLSSGKEILCEYNDIEISNDSELKFFSLNNNPSSGITVYTPYKKIVVCHYDLKGNVGSSMDITGVNTVKNYDSRTGLYNFTFKDAGIYNIKFFGKGFKTKEDKENNNGEVDNLLVNETTFIIEKSDNPYEFTSSLNLRYGFVENESRLVDGKHPLKNGYKTELTGSIQKEYFDNLKETYKNLAIAYTNNVDIFSKRYFGAKEDNTFKLGEVGGKEVKEIKLKYTNQDGTNSFTLFKKTKPVWRAVSEKNRVKLCYYLGLEYNPSYTFFSNIDDEEAENLINALNSMYEGAKIKVKNLTYWDDTTNTKKELGDAEQDIFASAYYVGKLWAGLVTPDAINDNEFKNFIDEMALNHFSLELITGEDEDKISYNCRLESAINIEKETYKLSTTVKNLFVKYNNNFMPQEIEVEFGKTYTFTVEGTASFIVKLGESAVEDVNGLSVSGNTVELTITEEVAKLLSEGKTLLIQSTD